MLDRRAAETPGNRADTRLASRVTRLVLGAALLNTEAVGRQVPERFFVRHDPAPVS